MNHFLIKKTKKHPPHPCLLQPTIFSVLLDGGRGGVNLGYLSQRTKRMCQVTLAPALMHSLRNTRTHMWTKVKSTNTEPVRTYTYAECVLEYTHHAVCCSLHTSHFYTFLHLTITAAVSLEPTDDHHYVWMSEQICVGRSLTQFAVVVGSRWVRE